MDLGSNKIGMEELRPGDHIYTWSSCYTYSRHDLFNLSIYTMISAAIYVGDGKVIHRTRGPGFRISTSSTSQPSNNDPVVCCNIQDFLCDGHLYRFEYRVSRFVFLINRPGTCTLACSNPPEQVLHRASYFLQHGFGNYDLVDCEDFALYCKTGFVKRDKTGTILSAAIILFFAAFVGVTVIPYRFLPAGLVGVLLVVCGMYSWLRLRADVRYRSDRAAVAVEKLQDHLSNAHNERENMRMIETKTTRWFLSRRDYIRYSTGNRTLVLDTGK
ncbi:hypothetical protein FNV43_RR25555 [Rhamnella rubrinervis]|uniref:LRAT domain-containing protein n=1 Tax=Rhamnella rubrinervis TaxID=2594499 RepID=A0A8K0E073_9ROSA|nr:hypothetical protein FNV43_RR25555 [Rhamnella rubrinervis]